MQNVKHTQKSLRVDANDLLDLIENVPAMVFIASPGPSNTFASRSWREYSGLSPEDTEGLGWQRAVHPEDLQRHMEKWRLHTVSAEPFEDETRFRRAADGAYRWFLVRAVPRRDQHGKVLQWYGALVDIHDRKQAEEALRRSEKELRDVIETIPVMAFSARTDGFVEFVNRRYLEYTNLTPESASGSSWQATVHPDDSERTFSKWLEALATGEPLENELRHRNIKGEYRWFLVRAMPLRDEHGNVLKWYGILIDIEDRKRAEEDRKRAEELRLEERVHERTRIARELHDTLLQSFQGTLLHFQTASELLPTRTAEAKRMLDRAIDMAAQAITQGRDSIQGLRSPESEINDLAVAIRTFGESYAADRGDDGSPVFQVEVAGVARELCRSFAGEVYRFAIEALRNCFQHAEARHIKVEIHYEEKEFRVVIRDDGKGIDSETLSGKGLKGHYGLHGMRERAKLIGSEMAIRSEVGAGTEIQLSAAAIAAYAAMA